MKGYGWKRANGLFLFSFLCLFHVACSTIGGEVAFEPYVIPLQVSVNSWGEINFSVDTDINLPTPIGVVTAGIVIDPSRYYEVSNTLTIRVNGEDHIYDLHGQDFSVNLSSGYYEQLTLTKNGKDLYLELVRLNATPVVQIVEVLITTTPAPAVPAVVEIIVTATPFPNPNPLPTTQPALITSSQSPEDFIQGYFDAINKHEYQRTWAMLSDNFKDRHHCCDSSGNYEYQPYVDWWNTIENVDILNVNVQNNNGSTATVTVEMRIQKQDGSVTTNVLAYDLVSFGTSWLFN